MVSKLLMAPSDNISRGNYQLPKYNAEIEENVRQKKTVAIFLIGLITLLWLADPSPADQVVKAVRVKTPPHINGVGDDEAWQSAPVVRTRDIRADLDIDIRVVYTEENLYLLVQFPDTDESRVQKPWIWNADSDMYEAGPQREDTFIFKWLIQGEPTTLSIYSDEPYVADIWFWKAERTDAMGYADDKIQRLNPEMLENSVLLKSTGGKEMYLQRKGDRGAPAYKPVLYVEFEKDMMTRFVHRTPEGSRGDIRAKGHWKAGRWTVEFGRKMNTGHPDDIQFDPSKRYFFGISRHEIGGREPDPALTEPMYGAGDVSEKLFLIFDPS